MSEPCMCGATDCPRCYPGGVDDRPNVYDVVLYATFKYVARGIEAGGEREAVNLAREELKNEAKHGRRGWVMEDPETDYEVKDVTPDDEA